ncbi:MAG: DNA cytosine methyltransferase [Idiomarina sp.]|nr:DNA cytosine methyltransferase [Idiomarina sp.]
MSKKYKLIDLFCGAGGMTLGFVGHDFCGEFESIFAIDNDNAAVKTYNANFSKNEHCIKANIEDWLENNDVPRADVVIGGPPCQGFSLLNKKRCGDSRRSLWEPYMDIVQKSGATIFVMENVPGLLKSNEFKDIAARAEELGFNIIEPAVLNMADYGVPQTRKRAIAIGYKRECFIDSEIPTFPPAPSNAAPNINSNLPAWKTVKDALQDLPLQPEGTEIRSNEQPPLDLHFGRSPTEVSLERYKSVPPGGNRFDLQKNRPDITPACWIKKTSGGTDLFGRLWWDRPSVTIRTEFFKPEKGRYLHPVEHRPITHREAARLMSFPDYFKFTGSKVEIAKQIGNAVPPVFAEVLAKYILGLLASRISRSKAA